ncbi:restriction endonuclease subunit S [Aliarcobacter skirrowii]|uniref:restriction endonuclease subunit S n=1 Tax=Aliarcobacter skirrowii TaxID=28200 RepID=UPI002A36833F|nr:restriction endonuclease subunit S [Aliarcobacter skirrowii]MDY0181003.1 restriction endonuclease subunit S [Aliarcobacter skirrowii]
MSSWKECKLGDIAEILNHVRVPLSAMERAKMQGKFPYYGASGIIDYVDDYLFDGEYVLISEDGENLKSRKTPIAFKASGKFWVNNHAHIVQGKKPFLNDLIVYYFKNLDLNEYITGAVQPKLNKANLLEIPFYLPKSEEEQKAIAEVLSSLDDKIDLLHRQNQTLESLAQTLFRQWFIEEAKEEWEEKPLSFFGDIICGKTPSKSNPQYFDGNIPFIKIPDMHGNTFIFRTTDTLSDLGKESQKNKTLPPKSICVSCIATVGLVSMNIIESQTNQQINSIVPNKDIYRYFLYLFMKSSYELLHAMASGGTATLNLNTGDFSKMEILKPDDDTLKNFHEILKPIFDKIFINSKQIQTLENLRDTLLPNLLSGEIKIKD